VDLARFDRFGRNYFQAVVHFGSLTCKLCGVCRIDLTVPLS
jgi:hypothetical protein